MSVIVTVEVDAEQVSRWLTERQRDLPKTMGRAQKETARELVRRYRRTSATWQHKPDFDILTEISGTTITVLGGTDDSVWNMLDRGTRPHIIRPKSPTGVLRFTWGGPGSYKAKTIPNSLTSRGGGATGVTIFRRWVKHPGTRARNWSKIIRKELDTEAPKIMRRHLERWKSK